MKHDPNRYHARRGFTLVELMVVIGIVSVTASLMLPSLAKARQLGQLHKCQANLRTIWLGMFYYAEDASNGAGHLPQLSAQHATTHDFNYTFPGGWWPAQIRPYVEIKRTRAGSKQGLLRCPAEEAPFYFYIYADPGRIDKLLGLPVYGYTDPLLMKAGTDARAAEGRTEFHIEPVSCGGSCEANQRRPWTLSNGAQLSNPPVKLAEIHKPYCYPVLTDGYDRAIRNCFRWESLITAGGRRGHFMRHFGGEDPNTNGVNWLFADGHVQWHSATYIARELVCCLSAPPFTFGGKQRIDQHCGR